MLTSVSVHSKMKCNVLCFRYVLTYSYSPYWTSACNLENYPRDFLQHLTRKIWGCIQLRRFFNTFYSTSPSKPTFLPYSTLPTCITPPLIYKRIVCINVQYDNNILYPVLFILTTNQRLFTKIFIYLQVCTQFIILITEYSTLFLFRLNLRIWWKYIYIHMFLTIM